MKLNLLIGLLLVLSLAGLSPSGAQQPARDLEARVAGLEAELVRSMERERALEERLVRLEQYVEGLSKSSATLVATLQASEEAGFTAGINPRSRELLLAGWREHLAVLRAGLPKPPAPPAAERNRR